MTDNKDALRQRLKELGQTIFHLHDDPAKETPEVWRDIYNSVAIDLLQQLQTVEAERDGLKAKFEQRIEREDQLLDHTLAFWRRHASPTKLPNSCFQCGNVGKPSIRHLELPNIYICESCIKERDKAEEAWTDNAALLEDAQAQLATVNQERDTYRQEAAQAQARVKVLEDELIEARTLVFQGIGFAGIVQQLATLPNPQHRRVDAALHTRDARHVGDDLLLAQTLRDVTRDAQKVWCLAVPDVAQANLHWKG